MTYALTLAAIRKLDPCEEGCRRVSAILPKRGKITAQMARDAGCTFDDLMWVAAAAAGNDPGLQSRIRHWLADCAARVLHIYERYYPNDPRIRNAIVAAHQFADGQIDDRAREAAWGAWDAARDAQLAARDAAKAAQLAAVGADMRAVMRAVWNPTKAAWEVTIGAAAWDAAWDAARDARAALAACDAARDSAWEAERNWQFERLIYWLSEETAEPLALPIPPMEAAA